MQINRLVLSCSAACLLTLASLAQKAKKLTPTVPGDLSQKVVKLHWKLVFSDEFNVKGDFDQKKWSYCKRQKPAWAMYLTSTPNYVSQNGGALILRMDNSALSADSVPYHSAGIQTSRKFNFRYGKVEVRAMFTQGKGSWPAIWMMPEVPTAYGEWPKSGEIDIMEHVNSENVVHQTIHNASVTDAAGGSSATHSTPYNPSGYNIYGIIWSPAAIQFYVNNELQYTYTKVGNASSKQWPFNRPFYIILNQSGGAGWPGVIKDENLPFEMKVDWVRVYK